MRRRDVAYDGDPVDATKEPSGTGPEDKITDTHRLGHVYANLLQLKHPRKAGTWFTAMVSFSPMDNMGARFRAPGEASGSLTLPLMHSLGFRFRGGCSRLAVTDLDGLLSAVRFALKRI